MVITKSEIAVKTAVGALLALIAWVLVSAISHAALYLLDASRGLSDDWLQVIFRELFTPAVGGYAAIYFVNRYLEAASLRWVAVLYCLPIIVVFVGAPLYFIVFHRADYQFSWAQQLMHFGVAVSSCIGSYVALRQSKEWA